MARIELVPAGPEMPRCPVWRGPRANTRCEKDAQHEITTQPDAAWHAGRSRRGYWFFWTGGDNRS